MGRRPSPCSRDTCLQLKKEIHERITIFLSRKKNIKKIVLFYLSGEARRGTWAASAGNLHVQLKAESKETLYISLFFMVQLHGNTARKERPSTVASDWCRHSYVYCYAFYDLTL